MDKLKITTSDPLSGEIAVSGTENAVLPLMYAGLLVVDTLRLKNMPVLADVKTIQKLLQGVDARMLTDNVHEFRINGSAVNNACVPYELVRTMCVSTLVFGPTLMRFGKVQASLPGGCAIGSRPVDQRLRGLETTSAGVTVEHDYVKARDRLEGTRVVTDIVTVGDTENLLMAATLAEGITVLKNCAVEPEVVDLAECLVRMGVRVSDIDTPTMTVEGVEELHGCKHSIVSNRIETGTLLCAVAVTGGKVVLHRAAPKTTEAVLEKLTEAGTVIEAGGDWTSIDIKQRPKAVSIRAVVYPGFPADMQAQFMAMNVIAEGNCRVVEAIFGDRFIYIPELNRMGASITTEGSTAYAKGMETLSGAAVMATSLRASVSLVTAGLIVGDETIVEHIYHLDYNYGHIEEKLDRVGTKIKRVSG